MPTTDLRRLPVLLAVIAAVTAGEPEGQRLIEIDRLPLQPVGTGSVGDGATELHPWALLSSGFDHGLSSGDTLVTVGRLGLAARWRDGAHWRVVGDGSAGARIYGNSLGSRPLWDARVEARRTPDGAGVEVQLSAGTSQADNAPLRLNELLGERSWNLGAGLAWQGNRLRLGLRGSVERTIYLDDNILFLGPQRDGGNLSGSAEIGWRLGQRLSLAAEATRQRLTYDTDEVFQDADRDELLLRVRQAIGNRSLAALAVGWERWRFADDFRQDHLRDDAAASGPVVGAEARWSWEHLSFAELGATHRLAPSLTSNAARATALAAALRIRLQEGLGAWARIEGSRIDDLAERSAGFPPPQRGRVLDTFLVMDWSWRRGLALRPRLSYRINMPDDGPVDRRVTADLTVVVLW